MENAAKTYFKNNDIDQWQDGYPNEETIEKDIENNEAYVLEEDGVILGTCMVTIHGEPAYNRIEGKWIIYVYIVLLLIMNIKEKD